MLRSTVVQNEGLIIAARWSPNSQIIAYCQGSAIALKPLAANSKLVKWQAHDGLVLAISWSPNSELIASAGEDTRYKVWDTQGTNIYTSSPDDYPMTTIDFSPDGTMLAVGSFNMIKLCHSSGVSCFSISSTNNLTRLAMAVEGDFSRLQLTFSFTFFTFTLLTLTACASGAIT